MEQRVAADDQEEGTAVVIQNPDGTLVRDQECRRPAPVQKQSYYTELPRHQLDEHSSLMEQLIAYAFDILGAHHLEVRVSEPK
ncbi:MAG: hypothetical protein RLZZ387_3911 [Chloroflexota bacterium]|jgi:hypothetical protein